MTFLLDTDVCVDLIRLPAPQLLASHSRIVFGELQQPVYFVLWRRFQHAEPNLL